MANVQYVPPEEGQKTDLARVCILGEPGVGKTRLAATFPDPFFLDMEKGAASARAGGVHRLIVPTDRGALTAVRKILQDMARAPLNGGTISYQVPDGPRVDVGTVVIDSIDAIQQPVKMYEVLRGRSKMERSDWDTLLNLLTPLVLDWHALPINVVVIAHTKRSEGEEKRPGSMDFGVQGSLRSQMPRWFSHILHIVSGPDGERFVVTEPTVSKGYRYLAKDRHHSLAHLGTNGVIKLPCDADGYPDDRITRVICRRED